MKPRILFLLLLGILLSFTLSGCIKARTSIHVEPNGSGTFGVAMGMTQQLLALASSQGADPSQKLTQTFTENEAAKNVKVKRWTEGEYEWFGGDVPFKNLDELNRLAAKGKLFESFSLTRKPGLFRDQFVLDARLKPLGNQGEIPKNTPFDPGSMFEIQMAVHLPGEVVETNGVYDGTSKNILWSVGDDQPNEIHAVSQAWNWLNMGIAGVLVGGGMLAVVGAVAILVYLKIGQARLKQFLAVPVSRMSNQVVSTSTPNETKSFQQPASPQKSPSQPPKRALQKLPSKAKTGQIQDLLAKEVQSDPIAAMGIGGYLEQINKQVFQGEGVIRQTPGQIVLGWSDLGDETVDHEIVIKTLDFNTFEINGQPIPATADHIKKGLVSCLKGLNRL